jgi:hypothetical protein
MEAPDWEIRSLAPVSGRHTIDDGSIDDGSIDQSIVS